MLYRSKQYASRKKSWVLCWVKIELRLPFFSYFFRAKKTVWPIQSIVLKPVQKRNHVFCYHLPKSLDVLNVLFYVTTVLVGVLWHGCLQKSLGSRKIKLFVLSLFLLPCEKIFVCFTRITIVCIPWLLLKNCFVSEKFDRLRICLLSAWFFVVFSCNVFP